MRKRIEKGRKNALEHGGICMFMITVDDVLKVYESLKDRYNNEKINSHSFNRFSNYIVYACFVF